MGNFVDSLWGIRVSQTRRGSLLSLLYFTIVGCIVVIILVFYVIFYLTFIYHKVRNNLSNFREQIFVWNLHFERIILTTSIESIQFYRYPMSK